MDTNIQSYTHNIAVNISNNTSNKAVIIIATSTDLNAISSHSGVIFSGKGTLATNNNIYTLSVLLVLWHTQNSLVLVSNYSFNIYKSFEILPVIPSFRLDYHSLYNSSLLFFDTM